MIKQPTKLIIGFIAYGKLTAKYLPYFLSSLKKQTFNASDVIVFDNTENSENENVSYVKKNYPEIEILRAEENIGFAMAYNRMIKRAIDNGAKYFLAINPDMILEPDAVAKMIKAMDNEELGSISPKILKWDFEQNKKTNIIDTCGIQMKRGLRFKDIGQGEVDNSQYDNSKIIGPSGAAGMYRISALQDVGKGEQYFDELMFMYKEDCDLAYRLFLAGYKSECVNDAIIYHDRTAYAKGGGNLQVALNRKNKNRQVKKWSFLNQQIIFIKYWKLQNFKNKIAVIFYEIKMIIFILLFEQYLLRQFYKLWNLKYNISIYKK